MAGLGTPPLRCFDPMAAALEGIARQRHSAPFLPGEEPLESYGNTGFVGAADGSHERAVDVGHGLVAGRPAKARQHGGGGRLRPAQRNHGAENAVRPEFDDHVDIESGEGLDGLAERDRRSRLASPVAAVEARIRGHPFAGHGAHHHHVGFGDLHILEVGLETVQRRIDQSAVVRGARPQQRGTDIPGLEMLEQRLDVGFRTADGLVAAVVRRHGEARAFTSGVVFRHGGGDHRLRGQHHGHGAFLRQPRDQVAAPGRESQALFQGEHACGLGGGDLAQAVTHNHVRSHAQARPLRGQGALQRVDRWLGPGRVVQRARARHAEHDVQ